MLLADASNKLLSMDEYNPPALKITDNNYNDIIIRI